MKNFYYFLRYKTIPTLLCNEMTGGDALMKLPCSGLLPILK